MKALSDMSNNDLAVEIELTAIRLFGFDTYKHENRDRSARLRAELDDLEAEATRRGMRDSRGMKPEYKQFADSHPAVQSLTDQNREFIQSRIR